MADLSPLYDALAPNPDADYGSILPYARNRPGSASWVQNGADTRWALPSVIREGLKGYLDLAQGTETGKVTPEALQAVVFGGMGAGAMMAPRGALAAGASRLPKGDIPEALYHVAGPTYRAGNDLKPPVNVLSRRDALDAFRAKWPEGDAAHVQKVFFHDDLTKAQTHVRDFGGSIYQVDPRQVRDLHIDDIEPEWATRYLVPWRALTPVGGTPRALEPAGGVLPRIGQEGRVAGPYITEEPFRSLRDRYGNLLSEASGGKDPSRIKLTDDRIAKAKELLEQRHENRTAYMGARAPTETTQQMRDAVTFAQEAVRNGYDTRFKVPDGPYGSLYVRAGDNMVRFADHPQPTEGGKVVGGYSKTLGRRHYPADASVSPTESTLDDVMALLRKYGLMAPAPVALPTDDQRAVMNPRLF